jgi:hypothetical protein
MSTCEKTAKGETKVINHIPVLSVPRFADSSPSYPFRFPVSDLLICEFDVPCSETVTPRNSNTYKQIFTMPSPSAVVNVRPKGGSGRLPERTASLRGESFSPAVRLSWVAQYIYQRVVRRKPVPFQRSPKHPEILGCYVEETLECGHKQTVYPQIDDLVARKRVCSECNGHFLGLELPKKVAQSVRRIPKKAAGKSTWALSFAGCCFAALALISYEAHAPIKIYQNVHVNRQISSTEFVLDGTYRKFCEPVRFELGYTLTELHIQDRGSCWSTKIFDPAWKALRDKDGWPILPANCTNLGVGKPVVCEGEPRW